ncbi:MAG: ABC transporter substrate-binding protein [Chloroflexi bacterium]|nr:ABC transporter substrate-binding protein [Chloroflexota bacterium]
MDWQANGRLRLLPDPTVWREGSKINALEFQFFPDEETLLEAYVNGSIHAINRVSDSLLPRLAAQPDTRLFTAPDDRYTLLLFNMDQPPSDLLTSLSGRQALAYLLDRPALIDAALNGQGIPFEGPYLPTSWAYNPSLLTPYSYDPGTAVSLLEAAVGCRSRAAPPAKKKAKPLLSKYSAWTPRPTERSLKPSVNSGRRPASTAKSPWSPASPTCANGSTKGLSMWPWSHSSRPATPISTIFGARRPSSRAATLPVGTAAKRARAWSWGVKHGR